MGGYNEVTDIQNSKWAVKVLLCLCNVIIEQVNLTASGPWATAWFGTGLNRVVSAIIFKGRIPLHVIHELLTELWNMIGEERERRRGKRCTIHIVLDMHTVFICEIR